MKRMILLAGLLLLTASLSTGYEVLLDIDLDGDPNTFNTSTTEDTVLVAMILSPEAGGEWITLIEFGMGGSCRDGMDCGWRYGTGTELYGEFQPWLFHPLFESSYVDGALCIDCMGHPGFHYILGATAAGDGFLLEENIFIHTFLAWAYADDDPECPLPESDLMTFPFNTPEWDPWCELLLAQESTFLPEVVPMPATWREVKSLY